jgi:sigma-B regulation protein RsbQ
LFRFPLAPQTAKMSSLLLRNKVTTIGSGKKTILFAHGFGCDQTSWQFITETFIDDYKIVLLDFIVEDSSDLEQYDNVKYSNIQGYVDDMLGICKELNITKSIFIGHGIGCMIGLLGAITHAGIFQKMIFISPSPYYLNDGDYEGGLEEEDLQALFKFMTNNYLGWCNVFAPALMGNKNKPELVEFLTDSFKATNPIIARAFANVKFNSDFRSELKNLTVKSLTLQGEDDILVPLSVGNYIKENTPGNSLIVMQASGHYPHISAPKETTEAIKSFIEQ